MSRRILAYSFAAVILIITARFITYEPNPVVLTGSVIKLSDHEWGLEVDFDWKRPFASRQVRIDDVNPTLLSPGTRLTCLCSRRDVIGSGPWSVAYSALNTSTATSK